MSFGFCYSFVLFLFTLVLPVDFVAAGFLKIIWHMFSSTQRKHEFPGRFLSQPCSLFLVFEFFFIKIDYCQSKIMTSSGGLCFFFYCSYELVTVAICVCQENVKSTEFDKKPYTVKLIFVCVQITSFTSHNILYYLL